MRRRRFQAARRTARTPKENPAISPRAKTPEVRKDEAWSAKRRLPLMSHPRFDIVPDAAVGGRSFSRMVGVC